MPCQALFTRVVLLVVFVTWQQTEKTLSIHSIDTPRREAFYWASVVATFALGTAVGDLTATTFHLGYFSSGLVVRWADLRPGDRLSVAGLEPGPLLLVRLRRHPSARGLLRRLDGQAPQIVGGLGWGDGNVAIVLTIIIFCFVAFLAITRADVQVAKNSRRLHGELRHPKGEPSPEGLE